MSKLPTLTGREVVVALERAGFSVIRTRSSHHFHRMRVRLSSEGSAQEAMGPR